MTTTPGFTLIANLEGILGEGIAGFLRVTLCGFGPILPAVQGVCMIADAGVPQLIGPQVGSTPIQVVLWGNELIFPPGTFYEIAVLDDKRNVVQTANYILTGAGGAGSGDLSNLIPIVPPWGFPIGSLDYLPCTGSGANWTAPGPVLAVAYNGVLMPMNMAMPTLSYTLDGTGKGITLNFTADLLDRIDAFVIL